MNKVNQTFSRPPSALSRSARLAAHEMVPEKTPSTRFTASPDCTISLSVMSTGSPAPGPVTS